MPDDDFIPCSIPGCENESKIEVLVKNRWMPFCEGDVAHAHMVSRGHSSLLGLPYEGKERPIDNG